MKEYILCAAIWYKDLKFDKTLEIPQSQYLPTNIKQGIVFCGHRHLQCLRSMNHITGKKQCEVGEEVQGFLTNKNRFVDRMEAAKIAVEANQLLDKSIANSERLFSEDLY